MAKAANMAKFAYFQPVKQGDIALHAYNNAYITSPRRKVPFGAEQARGYGSARKQWEKNPAFSFSFRR